MASPKKQKYKEGSIEALSADLRRRPKPPAPKKMASVINTLMARRGYAQASSAEKCSQAWSQAVGQRLARQSRAGVVRRGVLEITAENSAVVQELTFQKKPLIKKMIRLAPEFNISGLRFRVGAIG